MKFTRKLFAGTEKCPFRCAYCFAKTPEYIAPSCLDESLRANEFDIIYPACDSEFLFETNWKKKLLLTIPAKATKPVVVRFSTKASVSERLADELAAFDYQLKANSDGFLLVGVSFSTAKRIDELEPGTAGLELRIQGLKNLCSRSIASNITLRPLLPFVDDNEYFEIVRRTVIHTPFFLLGDLYVFPGSPFYEKYIAGRYPEQFRRVEWLDSKPVWQVLHAARLRNAVSDYIKEMGGQSFNTDLELVSALQYSIVEPRPLSY